MRQYMLKYKKVDIVIKMERPFDYSVGFKTSKILHS